MGVDNIPLPVLLRKTVHTVQPREQILPLDRQMDDLHFPGQFRFQLPSRRGQRDLMPVGYLFPGKFDYVTLHAPLFKLRDDVKNSHVMFLLSGRASGS